MRREFHVRFSEGGGVQLLSATELIDRRERVVCVREDHTGTGEAITTLVGVSLSGATRPPGTRLGQRLLFDATRSSTVRSGPMCWSPPIA